MTKYFCDLCGKEITQLSPDTLYKYKLRQGMFEGWKYIDAHPECVSKLCDTMEENRNKKDILGGN